MPDLKLPNQFIEYAADVLGDTETGLTGRKIIRYCNDCASDFEVSIPITSPNFGTYVPPVPNKRIALYRNLCVFNGQQQYILIKAMCEDSGFADNDAVQKLKNLLLERYSGQFGDSFVFEKPEETGWKRIDNAIEEMQNRFLVADTVEKFNAIAAIGRQVEIQIAKEVYRPEIHGTMDGDVEIGNADAKRMLQAYFNYELKDSEKAYKMAKTILDLCNETTHDFDATKREALLCVSTVKSLASLVKSIEDTKE